MIRRLSPRDVHTSTTKRPSSHPSDVPQLAVVAPVVGRCEVVAREHLGGVGEIEPAVAQGVDPLHLIPSQAHISYPQKIR